MTRLWFTARRYGWGWTPCSVEGWLVTIAVFVLLVGGDFSIPALAKHAGAPPQTEIVALVLAWNAVIVGAMIAVCWKTGERPRWRWGK